jgi:hypothetical protein
VSQLPALLVGVDTEADDQWSAEGRQRLAVRNAERLPALQEMLDGLGVRPTYFVTYEMATREPSRGILRELHAAGRCELGSHLHPWSSPPFRPEDQGGRYPSQLPAELLERQLRELTGTVESELGVRPTAYRAGRNGFDARTVPILESLGYVLDSSVDPLFNEIRKGGPCFAGAPIAPYFLGDHDVTRAGSARLLEVPISAATEPPLPKTLERLYARLPPLTFRGALRRLGIRPVWLRPSYTPLPDALRFAQRLARSGAPCLNLLFHSSELLPGASPYHPDAASVDRFLGALRRLLEHTVGELGAVSRTYTEFTQAWPRRAS